MRGTVMRAQVGLCVATALLVHIALDLAILAANPPRILIGEGRQHKLLLVDRASNKIVAENAKLRRIDCLTELSPEEFLVCDGQSFIRLGADLKERSRTMTRFTGVNHVTPTSGGRMLVSDTTLNTVDEVDAVGNLLWSVAVHFPSGAVRLPSGNTLVADGTADLKEFDANGRLEVSRRLRRWAASLHRLANGDTLVGESRGYELIDTNGRSVWFRDDESRITCIQALPGGEILVCKPDARRVAIFDADGRTIWQMTSLDYPWRAIYLQ
jgi:hypothetical protein